MTSVASRVAHRAAFPRIAEQVGGSGREVDAAALGELDDHPRPHAPREIIAEDRDGHRGVHRRRQQRAPHDEPPVLREMRDVARRALRGDRRRQDDELGPF